PGPFSVPFTAYVDAVASSSTLDPISEINRPVLSQFHLNQYQWNSPIRGVPSATPVAGDLELNVSYLVDPLTGSGYWHPRLSNSNSVQYLMRLKLREKVSP